jgi:hypothetical protein
LADGNYGKYNFTTKNSATTIITIKKATSADHCTDTGWSVGSMGSGQAVFGSGTDSWQSTTSSAGNYVLDGNGNSSAAGCGAASGNGSSDCGIKIDGSCGSGSCKPVDLNNGPANATFRYIEVVGAGAGKAGSIDEHDFFLGGATNVKLHHVYAHDSSCDFWQSYGANGATIEYSYFQRNNSSSYCHGQATWNNRSSNVTVRYNTFQDIQGTAVITEASAGQPGASDNWKIYGNVFWVSPNPPAGYQCLGNGIAACINSGETCTNWTFAQNTIVGFLPDNRNGGPAACGAGQAGIYNENAGSSYTIQNNLWYNNRSGNNLTWGGASHTENHNTWLSSGSISGAGGAGDIITNFGTSPFVSWTTGDFRLASENSNWSGGAALSSPYNVDPAGATRGSDGGWERGTYEFGQSGPVAPTTLTAISK